MGWEPGQVDGQSAQVKQTGQRIEAINNFGPGGVHDKIVSNDGLNADYVRINGEVVVDNSLPNPYPGIS
jgi:hypothetical protein